MPTARLEHRLTLYGSVRMTWDVVTCLASTPTAQMRSKSVMGERVALDQTQAPQAPQAQARAQAQAQALTQALTLALRDLTELERGQMAV